MLVAVSIPVFTSQLEKAREATDLANLRAAKAEAVTAILDGTATTTAADAPLYYNGATGTFDSVESPATKIGKGTAATVSGITYDTDPVYTQFKYDGGNVAGHSITAVFNVPTNGTEPSVEVKFN